MPKNHQKKLKTSSRSACVCVCVDQRKRCKTCTLPETNIASENGWLEYYFPIGEAYFQQIR